MSSRAIRRLREQREEIEDDNDNESESDEEEHQVKVDRNATFLAIFDDDESSSDESSSDRDEEDSKGKENYVGDGRDGQRIEQQESKEKEKTQVKRLHQEEPQQQHAENLDALLAEFESHDQQKISAVILGESSNISSFAVLVSGLDIRALDIEYVMRSSLMGAEAQPARAQRRSRQVFLFGSPRDDWVRPPHYVGGGMGMTTYDASSPSYSLPWPYVEGITSNSDAVLNPQQWYTFLRSHEYLKDCQDYKRIQETGDVNALALFITHHPYVVDALLQLCMVLYQTNQSEQGLALLRRCLWIYECASHSGFAPLDPEKSCFMDYNKNENASYFNSLLHLTRVASIAGCTSTALSTSRYLLSLDPLRDPMGVLLILDHFALVGMSERNDQFVVDLVESKKIAIHYQDPLSHKQHQCELCDMPNWAYSYALALYRLSKSTSDSDDTMKRPNDALRAAIQKFPDVVGNMLELNEVDVVGRSFQTDWPSILPRVRQRAQSSSTAAAASYDLIMRIFVQRNHKLWSGNDVLLWLYNGCQNAFSGNEHDAGDDDWQPSLALIRYGKSDPLDFEQRFRQLPDEANPLDPALLAPVMAIDPNRRRFLRQRGDAQIGNEGEYGLDGHQQHAMFGGEPLHLIDPDSPLMEVFLRSMLPWNHVDGVAPPER